ncbi:MAG: spore cortex biosynthesis protein YabQ [Ruminococcus sp.]|nr:spore cortex biosynthesis protein YabQ [Ruminococcus sp.]
MDIFTAAGEIGVFPSAIIAGAALGLIYDLLRAFRLLIPHGKILIFLGDFFYVLFFALVLFVFSTGLVGEIRYYTVFAMFAGAAAERFAAGRFIVSAAAGIAVFFRRKIFDRVVEFITKIRQKIRSCFVKTA